MILFDEIDSTSSEALRRIRGGTAEDSMVIVARRQTAGRGRLGRSWASPEGNLHMTLMFPAPADDRIGELAFVAALGAGEALTRALPGATRIEYKWPNDLMLGGLKLGGILIETDLAPDGRRWCALGMGVNVAEAPAGLPAACLADQGVHLAPEALVGPICASFRAWLARWQAHGFAPVRANWLASAAAAA